ncbi:hypothetical protein BDB01DRAFT_831918 [Pilobolus umbonatus]|nr:hypothetical protein BDB01DRAFT_831918 [Pilobolus umbonatus]
MFVRLRRSILQTKQLRLLSQGFVLRRTGSATPGIVTRSICTTLPRRLEEIPVVKETITPPQEIDLEAFRLTGNLQGAIKKVKQAEGHNLATPALYIQLADILRELPFDLEGCATVANWFYSVDSELPEGVLKNLDVWKSVLKLGFRLASTYRKEDLRALVDRFTEIFDLTTLDDTVAWELIMRIYGMLGKINALEACAAKNKDSPQFSVALMLSHAATNSQEKVREIFDTLQQNNRLNVGIVQKVIRSYAFCGAIEEVKKYTQIFNELFPTETNNDPTMLLIAHKVALKNILRQAKKYNGARGMPLKYFESDEVKRVHSSWTELTRDLLNDSNQQPVDIIDCNIILEYMIAANQLNPAEHPIEQAQEFFESFIPAHSAQPNEHSFNIMLAGLSSTQQYNNPHQNIRLDKTLEFLGTMNSHGIAILNHATFHSLFRACLPHAQGRYYFDNYRLNSLLPDRPYQHFTTKLDRRIFDIEKLMLEAHVPYDRYIFTTIMTCFAAGGRFHDLRKRWNTLKEYGFHRDKGMYRLAFALASLDKNESKRALTVLKSEMIRSIPHHHIDWNMYLAMLDCCVTAQLPTEAKEIMLQMRSDSTRVYNNKKKSHVDDLTAWPYIDQPEYYQPFLRASVAIPGLDSTPIIDEIDKKGIEYNRKIWELLLMERQNKNDMTGIQSLFHKYTMHRFEKRGLIPTPAREMSPIVPFPTAPYNTLDMKFIDSYVGSLVSSQNVSVLFDVLHTLNEQTSEIGLSHDTLKSIIHLARVEKSKDDLKWLSDNILPKISKQNRTLRMIKDHLDYIV